MKSIRIESITFQRNEHGPFETGLLINEGDGPIIDMDGKVVEAPIWQWRPNNRLVMELEDKVS
jgi:hypothetical protein